MRRTRAGQHRLLRQTALRGQAATLERLCVDRQLHEALAHGPDPLHLAAVFGLNPKTASRDAENATQGLCSIGLAMLGGHR